MAFNPKVRGETPQERNYFVAGYMTCYGDVILELKSLGQQCCGGCGAEINPDTGKAWGENYFNMAKMLESNSPKGLIHETKPVYELR